MQRKRGPQQLAENEIRITLFFLPRRPGCQSGSPSRVSVCYNLTPFSHRPPRVFLYLPSVRESCLALYKRLGPIILTLQKSLTFCTSGRRSILSVLSWVRYFTVRSPVRPSIRPRFISWVYRFRDRRRSILPMYRCLVRSRKSRERRDQMGTRGSHRRHVSVCDDVRIHVF